MGDSVHSKNYLLLSFLIKKNPCKCRAVIPALLSCSGRGRWSPTLQAQAFLGTSEGTGVGQVPRVGKGWKGAGREQLCSVPGVFGELQACA